MPLRDDLLLLADLELVLNRDVLLKLVNSILQIFNILLVFVPGGLFNEDLLRVSDGETLLLLLLSWVFILNLKDAEETILTSGEKSLVVVAHS